MAMKRMLLSNSYVASYNSATFPEDKKHTRSVEACCSYKPYLLIFHVPSGWINLDNIYKQNYFNLAFEGNKTKHFATTLKNWLDLVYLFTSYWSSRCVVNN